MNNLQVTTNHGILTAQESKDTNYPGISIYLNGELVAIVEQVETKIRTISYNAKNDDYVSVVNFN